MSVPLDNSHRLAIPAFQDRKQILHVFVMYFSTLVVSLTGIVNGAGSLQNGFVDEISFAFHHFFHIFLFCYSIKFPFATMEQERQCKCNVRLNTEGRRQ